jgi:hypothetical protein
MSGHEAVRFACGAERELPEWADDTDTESAPTEHG